MADLLYERDSYLREFEARVTAAAAELGAVALDRTAFYPGGGGQPCDRGWLELDGGQVAVVGVARRGERIWHRLEGGLPQPGDPLVGRLDWQRRYRLMRVHTALHILCGVIWRDYRAAVTGGNMEPLEGRLDFELERLDRSLVDEIEEKVNREVAAGREVRVAILPREEALAIPDLIRTRVSLLPASISRIRTVEIVGLDLQADGGTHVANTREVGPIRIVGYKSKGRSNKRIYVGLEAEAPDR